MEVIVLLDTLLSIASLESNHYWIDCLASICGIILGGNIPNSEFPPRFDLRPYLTASLSPFSPGLSRYKFHFRGAKWLPFRARL